MRRRHHLEGASTRNHRGGINGGANDATLARSGSRRRRYVSDQPCIATAGSSVGLSLFERGLVSIARRGRYGITPAGVAALYGAHAQTPPTFRASNNRATNQGRQRVIRK